MEAVWSAAGEAPIPLRHEDHPPHSSRFSVWSPGRISGFSTLEVPRRDPLDRGLNWGLEKSAHKT